MELDRRDFLKGAAVSGLASIAAGMVGCTSQEPATGTDTTTAAASSAEALDATVLDKEWAFEIPPTAITDDQITATESAEIVVVGSGLSGLCTAFHSLELGADVIVVTASSKPIGRGGSNNGINTSYQREHGIEWTEQDTAKLTKALQATTAGDIQTELWGKWIQNSGMTIDWLCALMNKQGLNTALEYGFVDPDGIYTSQPSAHNFWTDDQPNGSLFGAPMQAQAYAEAITEAGGRIVFNTPARQLVREDGSTGRVSAVIAQGPDGNYLKFEATKAVVLATGDFSKDPDMMAKYCPQVYRQFKDAIAWGEVNYDDDLVFNGLYAGEGHKMALWVGAAWQRTFPNAYMSTLYNFFFPHYQPGGFLGLNLNINGKRFMNESAITSFMGNTIQHLPGKKMFFIWDADYANFYDEWAAAGTYIDQVNGVAPLTPDETLASWDASAEAGQIFKADSLEALLENFEDLDKTVALESINNWNSYCSAGYDPEYQVSPTILRPIAKGPFYGCFNTGKDVLLLTVLGGLRTNTELNVLDKEDHPIKGLYCTGSMLGDFYAGAYTFASFGQNIGGVCCTLSYLLAEDLAKL